MRTAPTTYIDHNCSASGIMTRLEPCRPWHLALRAKGFVELEIVRQPDGRQEA